MALYGIRLNNGVLKMSLNIFDYINSNKLLKTLFMEPIEFKNAYGDYFSEIKNVKVDKIIPTDYDYNGLEEFRDKNRLAINKFKEMISNNENLPTITLNSIIPHTKKNFLIYDGHKRHLAHEEMGLNKIKAEIVYLKDSGEHLHHTVIIYDGLKKRLEVPDRVLRHYKYLVEDFKNGV